MWVKNALPKHVALGKSLGALKGNSSILVLYDGKEEGVTSRENWCDTISVQEKSAWQQFEGSHRYADVIALQLSLATHCA